MMKLTTPTKKEDILNFIITLWKTTEKECKANENGDPRDMMYYRGRYTAMLDLLKMVKIYEKEN